MRSGEDLVRQELEAHGLGFEMKLLTDIVPSKMSNPRLAEAHASLPLFTGRWAAEADGLEAEEADGGGAAQRKAAAMKADYTWLKFQPVLEIELFAALLYTGTDAQGQIRKALRNESDSEAQSWYWTIVALRHLVIKLAETPPDWLFHGLNNVRPPTRESIYGGGWVSYNNMISGSMSLPMGRRFALGEEGTAGPNRSNVGTVLHINMTDQEGIVAADMRWISKFPDEQEWLMIPGLSNFTGLHLYESRSEPLEGGELIHQMCTWSQS